MTNLVNTTGGALVPYSERRAAAAAQYVTQVREPPAGDMISLKGGQFSMGDEVLGDEIAVVTLNSVWLNIYYDLEYDKDTPSAPRCYAYGHSAQEMAPHISMADHPEWFVPQSEDCSSCQWNKFGSARKGKGKACSNKERLSVIPGGIYEPIKGSKDTKLTLYLGEERHEYFRDADALSILLSVTSVKNWNEYVRKLAETMGQPPYGVVTRMYIEKSTKHEQFEVHFECLEIIPDDTFDLISKRHEQAGLAIVQPFSPPKEREDGKPARVNNLVRT